MRFGNLIHWTFIFTFLWSCLYKIFCFCMVQIISIFVTFWYNSISPKKRKMSISPFASRPFKLCTLRANFQHCMNLVIQRSCSLIWVFECISLGWPVSALFISISALVNSKWSQAFSTKAILTLRNSKLRPPEIRWFFYRLPSRLWVSYCKPFDNYWCTCMQVIQVSLGNQSW